MALIGNSNEEKIWNYLLSNGLNKFGVAGLMGNLYAESGLRPNNLENLCERRLKENGKIYTDETYTAAIDNGTISRAEFLNPLPGKQYGYGLAQWTSPGRKGGLYDLVKTRQVSIADLKTQLDWLLLELKGSYISVYNVLLSANSVKEASDIVLIKFECPADTGTTMKNTRASYGQKYYDKYASVTTTKKPTGGNTIVGAYDKYINSTGTHYISNSGSDENGRYANGAAGDQTGNEWNIRSWYNRPWDCVLRYEKDSRVGMKLAELGCAAALNNKIGYDQYQRDTYWNQLKANGYDPSKITVACESDCSAGVIANTKAVGHILGIPALQQLTATYTGNMKNAYRNAGFTVLTGSKYTTGTSYLLPGDILLNEAHHTATNITKGSQATLTITPTKENTSYVGRGIGTAISKVEMNIRTTSSTSGSIVGVIPPGTKVEVLAIESNKWYKIVWPGCEAGYAYTSNSTGTYYSYTANKVESTPAPTPVQKPVSKVTATSSATSFNKGIAGTYKVTANSLNVRHGAGTNNKIMVAIPKGTKVYNYGYYSSSGGTKWYYVQFTYKNVLYTGFCSSNYLKKI